MKSDELIDALWAQLEPDVYIQKDQFVRGLADWEVAPIWVDGRLAFATLIKGPEFHYTSFGLGRPLSLAMLRAWLQPVLDRHGYATTRTSKSEPRQHRLNMRLGCRVIGEDTYFLQYRLER